MGFLKKNLNFFKIPKGGKVAEECVPNGNISYTCHFRPKYEVSFSKKSESFKCGKN